MLSAMGQSTVNFVLGMKCNLGCQSCLCPTKSTQGELDQNLAIETIHELKGLKRINFTGGEPTLWRRGTNDFNELVRFSTCYADSVGVNTNGTFLPTDPQAARDVIRNYRHNVVFLFSVDQNHADALRALGFSMEERFRTFRDACIEAGRGFEINLRGKPGNANSQDSPSDVLREFGITDGVPEKAYYSKTLALGHAAKLDNAAPLRLDDVINHSLRIKSPGLFINPRGLVLSSDHAAAMDNPPAFSVLGDLRKHTLADIFYDYSQQERTYNQLWSEGLKAAVDPGIEATWEVDQPLVRVFDPELCRSWPTENSVNALLRGSDFIDQFGKATITKAVETTARYLALQLADNQYRPFNYSGLNFKWIVRDGMLSFVWDDSTESTYSYGYHDALDFARHTVENVHQYLGRSFADQHFIVPLYRTLLDNGPEGMFTCDRELEVFRDLTQSFGPFIDFDTKMSLDGAYH